MAILVPNDKLDCCDLLGKNFVWIKMVELFILDKHCHDGYPLLKLALISDCSELPQKKAFSTGAIGFARVSHY